MDTAKSKKEFVTMCRLVIFFLSTDSEIETLKTPTELDILDSVKKKNRVDYDEDPVEHKIKTPLLEEI